MQKTLPTGRVHGELATGTLHEAMARATSENSKDKLRMTKKDKLERAWRFTALGRMTIPEIASATGVSERTVSNMRKIVSELSIVDPGDWDPRVDPLEITWAEAKGRTMGEQPVDDAWIERQARDWAQRLGRTFGDKLARNPEMALMALSFYSENLPSRLVEIWREDEAKDEEEPED